MIFRQLIHYATFTYTYVLGDEKSRFGVIIDPVKENVDRYIQLLEELNLKLIYVLDTHVHADHITGAGLLRERTGCATVLGKNTAAPCVSQKVEDNQILNVGDLQIKVIETPGHTDDSVAYYLESDSQKYLFTGDTLLIKGSGRTDFQNGNALDQYNSLFNKLLRLPDDTLVFPAHDYNGFTMSTIGEEKRFNPRLQVKSAEEYQHLMNNLNLPNPKYMDVAVPANLQCGKELTGE